jgi:hypothetical protein
MVADMTRFVRAGLTVLVATMTLAAAGCAVFDRWHSATRSVQVADRVDRVEVRGAATHVELTAGDGPISVQETVRYRRDRPKTSHRTVGTTLTLVDPGCGKRGCEVRFAVRLPASTPVSVDVSVGDVRVRGLRGDLTIHAEVGDVDAAELHAKSVVAHTGTGKVALVFGTVPDRVDAKTSIGEVDIAVPRDARYAVSCSGYAEVTVARDESSVHRITASSPMGISVRPT